jgi:RNA polymerase sigma factor (TIGR02999 family)
MADGSEAQITRMLAGLESGQASADDLLPLVYDELRALARARMAHEKPGQTLQATALVHEAWMRVMSDEAEDWNSRGHFFGAAAQAMRRILVEQARRKARIKHGGGAERVELDDVELAVEGPKDDVLVVEEALRRLEAEDARKGRIVELRYFAGLTVEETASVLELSVGTIEREWRFIRAWLQVELDAGA